MTDDEPKCPFCEKGGCDLTEPVYDHRTVFAHLRRGAPLAACGASHYHRACLDAARARAAAEDAAEARRLLGEGETP